MSKFKSNEEVPTSWREVFKDEIDQLGEGALALRGARYREDLTQAQLSKKTKIPQRHISEMERGLRPIGKNIAKRLAEALNVSYKVFL